MVVTISICLVFPIVYVGASIHSITKFDIANDYGSYKISLIKVSFALESCDLENSQASNKNRSIS